MENLPIRKVTKSDELTGIFNAEERKPLRSVAGITYGGESWLIEE